MTDHQSHNDRILQKLHGIPVKKGTWQTDHDPRNPNRIEANDNSSTSPSPPEARAMTEEELRRLEAKCARDAMKRGDATAVQAIVTNALLRPIPNPSTPTKAKSAPPQ